VTPIFVDTGAFYALADSGESTHRTARATLAQLEAEQRPLITTTDIVDEIVTLVRYRLGHAPALTLGERLLASSWCRVVEISSALRAAAWDIFTKYSDQPYSLTDCTSFAVMRAHEIGDAFAFDVTDFVAAGFNVLPVPETAKHTKAATPRKRRRR